MRRFKPEVEALLARLRAARPTSSVHYASLGLGDEDVKNGPWSHVILEFPVDGTVRLLAHGSSMRELVLSSPI